MSTATAPVEVQRGRPEALPAAPAKPIMTHRQILLVIYGLMAGMFLSSLDQTTCTGSTSRPGSRRRT